jgi:hypothetical protein
VEHFLFELTVAVLALVALAANVIILWRILGALRALTLTAEATRQRIEPILQEAQDVLSETKRGLSVVLTHTQASVLAVTAAAEQITDMAREQAIEVRALGRDSVLAARNQVERLDELVARTMTRVDHTVAIIQNQVLEPVREFHCLMVAMRRALQVLFARKRKHVHQVYQDEEMFI